LIPYKDASHPKLMEYGYILPYQLTDSDLAEEKICVDPKIYKERQYNMMSLMFY
jgi:hypothetical protein